MFALPPEWAFALESKRFSGSPTQFHIHRLTGGDARISTCLPQRAITVDLAVASAPTTDMVAVQMGRYGPVLAVGRGVSGALVAMRLADRLSVKSVTAHHRDRGSNASTGTRLTASA